MYIHGIILYAEQILSFIAYNGCIEGLEIDSLMKLQIRKTAGLRFRLNLALPHSLIGTIEYGDPKSCFNSAPT